MYTLFRKLEKMKKNILITWTSRWIWSYLLQELKNENEVIWISRTKNGWIWFTEFNIDLTKFEFFNKILNYLEQSNKKLDCIIINAWVWHFWKFEKWLNKKYEEIINLNLLSPIILLKELEPFLKEKAKIIFIGSIISKKFMKYAAVYQASKFGLRWFAGALKNEMKWKRIYIINPKIVYTDFHNNSEIEININEEKITNLDDIWKVVIDILMWIENRFEIDF